MNAPDERGMVLPLALLVLSVMGVVAGAVWVQAVRDQQLTRAATSLEQAFAAAEAGVVVTVASGAAADTTLPIGGERGFAGRLGVGGGWYRGGVVRLNRALFLIHAEGFSPDSLARQHVGLLVKLDGEAASGVRRLAFRAFAILY